MAIADIEREAAASQELYVVLLTRLNEIAAQKESIAPDARVLNAAVPPEAPAGPRRGLLAGARRALGLLGFTGAVLAADALSGRFESLGELEAATGLTVLGAVAAAGRGPSRRLVDRDIGTLPAEDGVELALALHELGRRLPARRPRARHRRLRGRGARRPARRGGRAARPEDRGDRRGGARRAAAAGEPSACRSTGSSSPGAPPAPARRSPPPRPAATPRSWCCRRRRSRRSAWPGPGSPTAASSSSMACARSATRSCGWSPACARPARPPPVSSPSRRNHPLVPAQTLERILASAERTVRTRIVAYHVDIYGYLVRKLTSWTTLLAPAGLRNIAPGSA